MNLSIIIVNYNTRNFLRRCLESLISNFQFPISNFEIIVVDNGSTDGSKEYLRDLERKKFRNIEKKKKSKSLNLYKSISLKVIFNNQNLGFAKAVNQGVKEAKRENLLLLNSDIVVKKGALDKLIDFAKKEPQVGVVGGCLLNPDGSPQGSCFFLPTLWRVVKEFWFGDKGFSVVKKYVPEGRGPSEVEAVTGAVFLIPKKVLSKVGFFNEHYFMYFEDLDYCRRVRKTGLKIYYLPEAKFIHAHGASGQQIPQQTHHWLVESSKIYHGAINYYLITFIIWLGQKCQKILKKK